MWRVLVVIRIKDNVTVSRLNQHEMTKSGWLGVHAPISPDSSLTRHLRSPHMKQRHRNRFSLTHLSTETTATLPEYAPAATSLTWQHQPPVRVQQHRTARMFPDFEGALSDRPPDYPDSADEADEEADSGTGEGAVFGDSLQSHPGASAAATPSPRRHFKRYASSTSPGRYPNYCHPHYARHNPNHHAQRPHLPNRRYKSSVALPPPDDDPYLDSLLARSVHALEMSNTLLQSSISTQTSLSELLQSPVVETGNSKPFRDVDWVDQLEERTNGLSRKIDVYGERKDRWMDDLETIRRDVERLFGDGVNEREQVPSAQCAVSSSVPTSSSMPARYAYKRRPSQLELQDSDDRQAARLTYSPQERSRLVAPTPCAVTQYVVASSTDPDSIVMQSTLGTPSSQPRSLESTPRAYNMLASFVQPPAPTSSASTPSSVSSPSVLASLMPKMRRRSNSSTATIPGREADDHLRFEPAIPGATADGFRGRTPRSPLLVRPMTPPTEESAGSSSSSESLIAKQTVMSLRRILEEQAAKSETALNASAAHCHRPFRAPVFLPVTPAVPVAGTSNTTASISRLFTKAIHSSSTRPPSPPKHSSLKNARGSRGMLSASAHQPEASTSSARTQEIDAIGATNSLLSVNAAKAQLSMLPELVSAGISKAFGVRVNGSGSATSSGQSTPKRISFAELPEGSRAEGRSSRFKEKQAQRRRRKQRNVTVLSGEDPLDEAWEADSESAAGGGWWSGWLGGGTAEAGSALAGMGGSSVGMYMSQHYEDRMESRLSRSWGSLGRLATAPGGLDEWTV
jgi:hypothetical protein